MYQIKFFWRHLGYNSYSYTEVVFRENTDMHWNRLFTVLDFRNRGKQLVSTALGKDKQL